MIDIARHRQVLDDPTGIHVVKLRVISDLKDCMRRQPDRQAQTPTQHYCYAVRKRIGRTYRVRRERCRPCRECSIQHVRQGQGPRAGESQAPLRPRHSAGRCANRSPQLGYRNISCRQAAAPIRRGKAFKYIGMVARQNTFAAGGSFAAKVREALLEAPHGSSAKLPENGFVMIDHYALKQDCSRGAPPPDRGAANASSSTFPPRASGPPAYCSHTSQTCRQHGRPRAKTKA